jgi:hypothetical protein
MDIGGHHDPFFPAILKRKHNRKFVGKWVGGSHSDGGTKLIKGTSADDAIYITGNSPALGTARSWQNLGAVERTCNYMLLAQFVRIEIVAIDATTDGLVNDWRIGRNLGQFRVSKS